MLRPSANGKRSNIKHTVVNMASLADILRGGKGSKVSDLMKDKDRGIPGSADAARMGVSGAMAKSMGMTEAEYQSYLKRKALEDAAQARRDAAAKTGKAQ